MRKKNKLCSHTPFPTTNLATAVHDNHHDCPDSQFTPFSSYHCPVLRSLFLPLGRLAQKQCLGGHSGSPELAVISYDTAATGPPAKA